MLQGDHHGELRHHLWRLKYTELNEIFAFMSLRSFALSLISIYIPIYLYLSGLSLRKIFVLYGLMFFFELVVEYFTAINIKKYGPKHLITASVPFIVFHFFQLFTLTRFDWPIWSIALTGGITLGLYWQSYHYDFSRAKHRKKTSREIGKLYILIAILGAIAPLLGGVIAYALGIGWVFAAVMLILMFAALVLFKTKDKNFHPGKLDLKKVKISEIHKDLIAYGGNMIEVMSAGTIWPIFLFLIVGSYQSVGAITSVTLLVTIVITYYISKKSDGGDRNSFVKWGGFLNGIVSFLKVLVSSVPQAFGISLAQSFSSSVQATPFVSEYYLHADEESRSEYIYLMESVNDFAKVLYFLVLYLLTFIFLDSTVLIIGLVLGAFGALASMLMPPAQCEICGQIENKKIRLSKRIAT